MLELQNICVKYSYKTVLTDVSYTFEKGKIYSLLGENGAGKSTLAHVICGDKKPTSGKIILNGKVKQFSSPKQAISSGICVVHQRPLLAPSISIKENLIIGHQKYNKQLNSTINNLMNEWLPNVKSSTLIKDLSPTELFFVSLISTLLKKPKILILDEPAALPLEKIRKLAASGISLITITHSIKEAITKTDKIILLKNGVIIDSLLPENTSETEIKNKLYTIKEGKSKHPGLIKAVMNEEKVFKALSSRENIKNLHHKIGYIPSDKTFRASNPNLTILQLLTAGHCNGTKKELEKYAKDLLKKADVNIKLKERVYCLSGGMLQRLILERELAEKPETLLMFNPTQGLDIEAKNRLFSRLDKLAQEGTTVILGEWK